MPEMNNDDHGFKTEAHMPGVAYVIDAKRTFARLGNRYRIQSVPR